MMIACAVDVAVGLRIVVAPAAQCSCRPTAWQETRRAHATPLLPRLLPVVVAASSVLALQMMIGTILIVA